MRVLAVTLLVIASACAGAEAEPKASSSASQGPLVLELFTSQGCSSCPPADAVLAKLATTDLGRPVAPLSFHVDYWNSLGWADPFSRSAWTERQHAYATALGDDRVYTPELVIGGAVGLVGSYRDKIHAAIKAHPRIALLEVTGTWTTGTLEVTATAPANTEVYVAVWEAQVSTDVPRGENAGATLVNARVVRALERVRAKTRVALDSRWRDSGAVAFAVDAKRRIVASAFLPK